MQNQLIDSKKRTWNLAVTIDAVIAYEAMADIKVFEKLFELWKKYRDSEGALEVMLAMIADLFPGMKEAASFAYACASLEGAAEKPTFREFCEVVGPIECGMAVTSLTQKLRDFMPEDDKDLKRGKGADGARPLGR